MSEVPKTSRRRKTQKKWRKMVFFRTWTPKLHRAHHLKCIVARSSTYPVCFRWEKSAFLLFFTCRLEENA